MNKVFFSQNVNSSYNITGNGYLYNNYAVTNSLFPPTDFDLVLQSDMMTIQATLTTNFELKQIGVDFWNTSNGTNISKFSAIGSGWRDTDGTFVDLKNRFRMFAHIDSSTFREFQFADSGTISYGGVLTNYGLSVRLKYSGGGSAPSTVTDYDGNVYDIINIGGVYVTVQNWKCTKLNNGTSLTKVTDATAWSNLTTEGYCAYGNNESNV